MARRAAEKLLNKGKKEAPLRALTADEPPPVTLPKPPAHLDADAKKEWKRAGGLLLELGAVDQIDLAALSLYCVSWSRWVYAEQQLAEFGMVVRAPNTGYPVQSPWLPIANRAWDQVERMVARLGLLTSTRQR